MAKGISDEDINLLDQLGVETTTKKKSAQTPREQRIIAGFEEIERFVKENGRPPEHGENKDIFERLYAVRLEQIRKSPECVAILEELDSKGLLEVPKEEVWEVGEDGPSDDELLEALGVETDPQSDITDLKHIKPKQEPEEVAQRTPCTDFNKFKPLFTIVQQDLETESRKTLKYQDNGEINKGDLFIVEGQKAFVAEVGEMFTSGYGRADCRLRVIFDNGTESNLLLRSLQRALNRDETSRRITDPSLGPLFSSDTSEEDTNTGHIYVLRSKSEHPFITENRTVIHKIGVTGGSVEKRISNAKKDPTYLLAEVEVVAAFKLSNLNPSKLEKLLHKFFAGARLDLNLKDRFSLDVEPREWFLVPLNVIE
ncbi:GIY-YIG nuclease family protein [Puniceicoccaceae bacterium K14]|nr:GIY-YIG nuclease family protein [Puniceicoccaceae bacterium K14]